MDFFEVCKCGMLCASFYFLTGYDSAVMEFWPLPFEQRITLFGPGRGHSSFTYTSHVFTNIS